MFWRKFIKLEIGIVSDLLALLKIELIKSIQKLSTVPSSNLAVLASPSTPDLAFNVSLQFSSQFFFEIHHPNFLQLVNHWLVEQVHVTTSEIVEKTETHRARRQV